MFCLYCGTRLPDDAIFCLSCGRRQTRIESNTFLPTLSFPDPSASSDQFPTGNRPLLQEAPQSERTPVETQHPLYHELDQTHENNSGRFKIGRHLSRRAVITSLIGGGAALIAGGIGIGELLSHNTRVQNTYLSTPTPRPPALGTILLTYTGVSGGAGVVAWAPHNNNIAAASKVVYIWDASTGDTLLTYRGHSSYLRSVVWSHSGTSIASGGGDINSVNSDLSVQVWNPTTGNLITTFNKHRNAVLGIAWSPNDQQVASCAFGDNTYIWDAATGNIDLTYNGNPDTVLCIAWCPDGSRIATGGGHGTINIWDSTTGNIIRTYLGHNNQVNGISWSPDGRFITSISGGNSASRSSGFSTSLQVWSPSTGAMLFHVEAGGVSAIWSHNGKRILATSSSQQIYDATNGHLLYSFDSQSFVADWSPDDTKVVSRSNNSRFA